MKKREGANGGTINVWEKGESGNKKGRPKKVFSKLAKQWKDAGYERATPAVVAEVYEYLLTLPLRDVIAMAGKPLEDGNTNDYPALVRIASAELIGRRRREILDSMLDRAHGRPKIHAETVTSGTVDVHWHVVKQYDAPDNDTDQETNNGARPAGR